MFARSDFATLCSGCRYRRGCNIWNSQQTRVNVHSWVYRGILKCILIICSSRSCLSQWEKECLFTLIQLQTVPFRVSRKSMAGQSIDELRDWPPDARYSEFYFGVASEKMFYNTFDKQRDCVWRQVEDAGGATWIASGEWAIFDWPRFVFNFTEKRWTTLNSIQSCNSFLLKRSGIETITSVLVVVVAHRQSPRTPPCELYLFYISSQDRSAAFLRRSGYFVFGIACRPAKSLFCFSQNIWTAVFDRVFRMKWQRFETLKSKTLESEVKINHF